MFLQWLFVGTHRLYLEDRPAEITASAAPGARQKFELRGGRVEPEIVATDTQRLTFPVTLNMPSTLHLRAIPTSAATIEVALFEHGQRRTLRRQALNGATDIAQAVPSTDGIIELVNEGAVRWLDPRLVDEPNLSSCVLGLFGLLGLAGLCHAMARAPAQTVSASSWLRMSFVNVLMITISIVLSLGALELGLRALGSHLPPWIAVERRNLGEMRADPRWQDSAVYGPRLSASIRTVCQWQHGDIVRMGFLPPDLVQHPAYNFPLITDADGFRNTRADPAADIAALGDSFTDALTLPAEFSWPSRLGSLMHTTVRNYGTAGFGPGQELRVLKQYVLPRRPRVAVVGFFAGNDLQDAERFERFEQNGGAFPSSGLGWKFKPVIARFDQLYLMSLYQGAASLARERQTLALRTSGTGGPVDYSGDDVAAAPALQPTFERGLFSVPVSGHTLRFAFLPPYLNCLKFSREELQAMHGWDATRRAYKQMQQLAREQGTRLAVMFIPSKSQVYLPLAESSFSSEALAQAVAVSLRDVANAPNADLILRHRLALNGLMRDFCAEEGIPFLDLTDALRARMSTGQNVYFPDDSHWNAAGQETAAAALAEWLPRL